MVRLLVHVHVASSRCLHVRVKLVDNYAYASVHVYRLTSSSAVYTSRNLCITNDASAILGVIIV